LRIQFGKFHLKFSRFTSSFWIFKWEWNMIAIVYFSVVLLIRCNPFSIFCISVVVLPRNVVCSWGVQDQYSWCGLPKVVCFLRGSRSLFWCVLFVILFWLHSGLPSGFWGLVVALGVRVNQYKFVCVILSFPYLTYICFKLFLLTTDKNNRLNRKNNRLNRKNNRLIFWKSTKNSFVHCFP